MVSIRIFKWGNRRKVYSTLNNFLIILSRYWFIIILFTCIAKAFLIIFWSKLLIITRIILKLLILNLTLMTQNLLLILLNTYIGFISINFSIILWCCIFSLIQLFIFYLLTLIFICLTSNSNWTKTWKKIIISCWILLLLL
jgi:hypothetical protein